ncbi:hypothetical protein [Deinococcus frigens]|uniref:hypothetical protein n=1 Tax=Deinococcus frigens TaxID=249403 RepID=UPI0012EBDE9D|nr:hypothetical protein [Deinococcus frigens]
MQFDVLSHQHADQAYGTLAPGSRPGSVRLRGGLHFTPAWNPDDEIRVSVQALGTPPDVARQKAWSRVRDSARRRASCGVDWSYLRLTVQAVNVDGEVLARESVGGVPSDLNPVLRAQIESVLHTLARQGAEDWAILGLN